LVSQSQGRARRTAACCLVFAFMILLPFLSYRSESEAAKKATYLTVAAGVYARRDTVVTFELPEELKGNWYGLRDESGGTIPLQVEARQATFVLPELAAGARKSYQVVELKGQSVLPDSVRLARVQNRLNLEVAGRPVLSFVTEPLGLPSSDIKPIFLRGGYIHPVNTPSGRIVTDDYPSDHYHHHGIWFAWTKTEFEGGHPDFWNMGDGTGRVEFEAIDSTWSGPVHAGFKSRQRYVALTGSVPKTALNEQWDVRVYSVGKRGKAYFMFDIAATQQCATGSPLVLDEYRYGGMGVRGHRNWKDKSKISFLTSEGKNRLNGNATRARWCHVGGPVENQLVGIAVLDHPDNFRAPTPLRIHPDDPYFNYAPSQMGKFEIKPGDKFTLRYRFIIADGPPDPAELNRLWNDYANPPQVTRVR
jgi:hypothetical protein